MNMKKYFLILVISLIVFPYGIAFGGFTEHWTHSTLPDAATLSRWNSITVPHTLSLQVVNLSAAQIQSLTQLKNVALLSIETQSPQNFTQPEFHQALKNLAQAIPLQWVPTNLPVASSSEIEKINQIPFHSIRFRFNYYPDTLEMKRLGEFQAPLSTEFNASAYPRYDDREMFHAMPPTLPISISADYWPWYTQMDIFNLIPQPLHLSIRGGALPAEDNLSYLRNIHRLQSLELETDFDLDPDSFWSTLEIQAEFIWNAQNFFPSADTLKKFEFSSLKRPGGKGQIHIHSEVPPSTLEKTAYIKSKIPVTWSHNAP